MRGNYLSRFDLSFVFFQHIVAIKSSFYWAYLFARAFILAGASENQLFRPS